MDIADFLEPRAIIDCRNPEHKKEILEGMCRVVAGLHPGLNSDEMLGILLDRERLGSTGIGHGVAIPHGKMKRLDRLAACFCRTSPGVEFESVDSQPVYFIFLVLAPENQVRQHLKALAMVLRILKRPSVRDELMRCASAKGMFDILTREGAVDKSAPELLAPA